MPSITAGSVGTYTLTATEEITVTLDSAEYAEVYVSRSGRQVFGQRISSSRSLGQFNAGDVVSITAVGGTVDYAATRVDTSYGLTSAEVAAVRGVVAGSRSALRPRLAPLRLATFGDSTANVGSTNADLSQVTAAFPASGATVIATSTLEKLGVASRHPCLYLVANGGISGETTTAMLARDSAGASASRKATADIVAARPDVIIARCGSINDLLSVTAANIDATVAAVAVRHASLIARLAAGGAVVIDEGIAGFTPGSNTPTDLEQTRAAIRRLNAMYAAAAVPPRVLWLDPVGLTCDAAGAYLPGLSADGTHPSVAGAYAIGEAELAIISAYFGPGLRRYDGPNLASNPNMAVTTLQAYGTLATGYGINISNATRQNAAVSIGPDGKLWQTCEFTSSAASGQGQIAMPYTPQSWGLSATDVLGVEFDFFVESIDKVSPLPEFVAGGIMGRLDTYKTAAGRVVLDALGLSVQQSVGRARVEGRCIFQPWLVGEASGVLTSSSTSLLSTTVAASGQSWRSGISDFRVVRLGAAQLSG